MTDPFVHLARIEGALFALHGMFDMGCRKATGKTLDDWVEAELEKPEVKDPLRFGVLCAFQIMKGVLDGKAPPHRRGCTVFEHEEYNPANCICGAEQASVIDLGHGIAITRMHAGDLGLTDLGLNMLRQWIVEQVALVGGAEWQKRGPQLVQDRLDEIARSRQTQEDTH